jgi:hypothetical protein
MDEQKLIETAKDGDKNAISHLVKALEKTLSLQSV